jgi:DNA-binding XRE family transcriptional regulator
VSADRDRHRLRAQGAKLRELEDRLDDLRTAVLTALDEHAEGKPADEVFADLRTAVEHVPAGRWNEHECIAKAHEWAKRFGEPPAAIDWNPSAMRQRGRTHLLDRWNDGDWPSVRTIIRLFGTWNRFLVAAGYPPRLLANPANRGPGGAGKGLDHLPEWVGWRAVSSYRDQRGLSQDKAAKRANISLDYFRAVEKGEQTNPGVRVVIAIARALTVRPSELLNDPEIDDA